VGSRAAARAQRRLRRAAVQASLHRRPRARGPLLPPDYSLSSCMSATAHRALSPTQRAYRFVNRPYYIYRPSQLRLRLRANSGFHGEERLLRTAWGSELYCWPDTIGRAVARMGVHDLVVMESLARLADPGELALVPVVQAVELGLHPLARRVQPRSLLVQLGDPRRLRGDQRLELGHTMDAMKPRLQAARAQDSLRPNQILLTRSTGDLNSYLHPLRQVRSVLEATKHGDVPRMAPRDQRRCSDRNGIECMRD